VATLGHLAVGMAAARAALPRATPTPRLVAAMIGLALCASAPDLDVIAFALGIPYAAEWGHRGAAHSLGFALALALLLAGIARGLGAPFGRALAAFAASLVSHGLLDIFTDGGLGIALFWPFSDTRVFAPWQPLPVAPIGAGMLSRRGLEVLVIEAVVFAPLWLFAVWPRRPER
jgi:inner membrane protein